MNTLTVKQRKILYAAIGGLMLVAIVLLGAPAARDQDFQSQLARRRAAYDLGEASLGDVDPTGASMNLVLLGMRGVAASVLGSLADEQMKKKNFVDMRATVESIVKLQPHFRSVWQFQAWNLGYNVSTEYDSVDDRYFWVKQGAKFMKRGVERNRNVPELYFDMGQFLGRKLGTADEKESFRKFFLVDPDVRRWQGGPDEDINPEAQDHYLVARGWYQQANEKLQREGVTQHIMDLALFIAYPYRSLMDYAEGMQQEGVQRNQTDRELTVEDRKQLYQDWSGKVRVAWENAAREWTAIYGRERIQTAGGGKVVLENDESGKATMAEIAEEEKVPLPIKMEWQENYRVLTRYPFWRQHAEVSALPALTESRFLFAEAKRLFKDEGNIEESRAALEKGLSLMEPIVKQHQVSEDYNVLLFDEQDLITDILKAQILWRSILERFLNVPVPSEYPLKQVWDNPQYAEKKAEFQEVFEVWASGARGG